MKIIKHSDIQAILPGPATFVEWVEAVIVDKYNCIVPAKTKIYMRDNTSRFTTMPCYMPNINSMGLKVGASRFPNEVPAIDTSILLFDASTGEFQCIMDGHLITAMRTGAVAALSIRTLKCEDANNIAIIGLGVTARATLLCMLDSMPDNFFKIKLKRYKDQAELFVERFSSYGNVSFQIVDTDEELVRDSDVVVSCITVADGMIAKDEWFKEGVTLVPVHTRGFENCDLFFDKVFGDVTEQISGFGNFSKFKKFNEFSEVLTNKCPGRENNKERILVYNIGMGLHDIYIGHKIFELIEKNKTIDDVVFKEQLAKFFI
jgi:ornithine cyclodeaminase/alanine dehydrogenase-like protein (mu-crystallin family)